MTESKSAAARANQQGQILLDSVLAILVLTTITAIGFNIQWQMLLKAITVWQQHLIVHAIKTNQPMLSAKRAVCHQVQTKQCLQMKSQKSRNFIRAYFPGTKNETKIHY